MIAEKAPNTQKQPKGDRRTPMGFVKRGLSMSAIIFDDQ
jgi:hypothetical protein